MLTFTIPQSLPLGPIHLNMFVMSSVNRLLDSPCCTLLLILMASSMFLIFIAWTTGTNTSCCKRSESLSISLIVGKTKFPLQPSCFFVVLLMTLPPHRILPPCFLIDCTNDSYCKTWL
eukprot:NODE_501_length_7561_cov_0.489547.p4 type:complete len:118 gc:universal NODE_501_length_7561_cov_0.489547:2214-2567(+)